MFGKKIDNHITMLQRIVSLLRDLILAMVALFTIIIVYYKGNPATLNALDWSKLIGAALLIIFGPIISFIIIKGIYRLLLSLAIFTFNIYLPEAPIPQGNVVWVFLKLTKKSKRQYIMFVRKVRRGTVLLTKHHPRAAKLYLSFFRFMVGLSSAQSRINPYLIAILILVFSIIVFRQTITKFIP